MHARCWTGDGPSGRCAGLSVRYHGLPWTHYADWAFPPDACVLPGAAPSGGLSSASFMQREAFACLGFILPGSFTCHNARKRHCVPFCGPNVPFWCSGAYCRC